MDKSEDEYSNGKSHLQSEPIPKSEILGLTFWGQNNKSGFFILVFFIYFLFYY